MKNFKFCLRANKKMWIAFCAIFIVVFSLVLSTMMFDKPLHAAADSTSSAYGFSVDEDLYDVSWFDGRKIVTEKNNDEIGVTYVNIGRARAKKKVNGKLLTTYMINVKTSPQTAEYSKQVLWWRNYWKEYGFFKNVQVKANLPSYVSLVDSGPKHTASSTTYSFGIGAEGGASGASAGISAGVSFESHALNITNNSNTYKNVVDMKIALNESIWRWDWPRYKYANQENRQLFSFSVLSDREFHLALNFSAAYGTTDSVPNYWSGVHGGTYTSYLSGYYYSR